MSDDAIKRNAPDKFAINFTLTALYSPEIENAVHEIYRIVGIAFVPLKENSVDLEGSHFYCESESL